MAGGSTWPRTAEIRKNKIATFSLTRLAVLRAQQSKTPPTNANRFILPRCVETQWHGATRVPTLCTHSEQSPTIVPLPGGATIVCDVYYYYLFIFFFYYRYGVVRTPSPPLPSSSGVRGRLIRGKRGRGDRLSGTEITNPRELRPPLRSVSFYTNSRRLTPPVENDRNHTHSVFGQILFSNALSTDFFKKLFVPYCTKYVRDTFVSLYR